MKREQTKMVAPYFEPNGSIDQIQNGAEGTLTVTLTAAQIKALRATPVEIIPAPSQSGRLVQIVHATLKMVYGGTNAFTETADNLQFKYENGSGLACSEEIEVTGFIGATADALTNTVGLKNVVGLKSAMANKAIVLHNTGDGEIGGNAANNNTVEIQVRFRVLNV